MLIYNIFSGSDDFRLSILTLVAILCVIFSAMILHELAHGAVALANGDYTAKMKGRLSLNPIKHIDPLGFVMMLLVGFGWAKPVPVDSRNFRNYKKGMITTSLAGVTVNFILALISLAGVAIVTAIFKSAGVIIAINNSVYIIGATTSVTYAFQFFYYLFVYGVLINMTLMIFNLIPVYPLDGFRVVETLVSPNNAYVRFNYRYGNYTLIALILLSVVIGYIGNFIGVELDLFSSFQDALIKLINKVMLGVLG
ncbi:MAG: site-2 protease family protein [Clostridia bacterium]|nr:site-2 protease family protein [Clostridia bacterium]